MSDWLLPEQGARPWLPGAGATEVLVLNEYDIPLMGLIGQGGTTYLYVCLLGELEDLNIWAYIRVDEHEVTAISSVRGDQVAALAARLVTSRPATVALAHDHELKYWLRLRPHGEESPLALAGRFIEELRPALESIRKDADELARLGDVARAS